MVCVFWLWDETRVFMQADFERMKAHRRQRQMRHVQGRGYWTSVPAQLLLRAGHLLADHTRNALILSVFGFKVTHTCSPPTFEEHSDFLVNSRNKLAEGCIGQYEL